jgi:asparagine synthase (glutamine-hydrolysing)
MSRLAVFVSADGAAEPRRAEVVRAMLAAMPRDSDALCSSGDATLGWSGSAGGGTYRGLGLCVALDGEIFNAAELAAELGARPASDADAVARLYRRHGFAGALARLNGDFALGLYDERSGTLWLGRDRLGLKPLYYAAVPDGFACASQPAGLLRVPGVAPEVNRRYAALVAGSHYRTFDNAPGDAPFASMRQLPAAHYLEMPRRGAPRLGRYWQLRAEALAESSEAALADRYRATLMRAVERRLACAGRPAFTLSGGMDSSSVLCCAAILLGRRQHAFSSVYTDPTYDERAEIRDVVEARVERWYPVELGRDLDVIGTVRELVAIHNEPVATATWLSHHAVCGEVARSGFDALFGGLGGDELNAGEYEYFPMFFADLRAAGHGDRLAHEIERWATHHDHPVYRKDATAAQAMIASLTVAGSRGVCRPNLERQRRYAGAVRPSYFDLARFEPAMEHPFASFLANRAYQDLARETTPCCIRAEDRQCTAAGLRRYDPFLDHEVVELMFAVPGSLKIRDGVTKWLLRQAMRDVLPEATRMRVKKTGWNAPAHVWFSGRGLDAVRDLVRSRRFRERGLYDAVVVERLLDEHQAIVDSGVPRENHMMFLWQLVNVDAWFGWIEDGCPARTAPSRGAA